MALKGVLRGDDFQSSFALAYQRLLASQWPDFVASLYTPIAEHKLRALSLVASRDGIRSASPAFCAPTGSADSKRIASKALLSI
jgi:hypothetical protein